MAVDGVLQLAIEERYDGQVDRAVDVTGLQSGVFHRGTNGL